VASIETLFEDERILAVNKPSGIPSHDLPGDPDRQTVESWLKEARGSDSTFLVHRLDTGTSGVLLFAKTAETHDAMREKFKAKTIHKLYRAWSDHFPVTAPSLPLEITLALAHHPKSKKRMIVLPPDQKRDYRGKPIPAHSRILSIEPQEWSGHRVNELRVEIVTGVMHQIRVHLKHWGYPLIGDPIYQPPERRDGASPFSRLGLHAEKIEFELNGFVCRIEAPVPPARAFLI
jgi:RluA family pseudouridine synthase